MSKLIKCFILLLLTLLVYSGVLFMINTACTICNIAGLIIGFFYLIVLYKILVKIFKSNEND